MTKELEALNVIKNSLEVIQMYNRNVKIDYGLFDTVETALKHLEEYDSLLKEYDIKLNEIREAFIFYKMKKEEYQNMRQRLESIDNSKPNEALECLERIYANVDTSADYYFVEVNEDYNTIKQALIKSQEDEKLKVDICEMFGLDNLFPYNDTKAILKELEEYMGRKNQLWVDFMKTSKELKEQKKVLEIIKEHPIASAITIQYIKTNKDNLEMLDFKCYCTNFHDEFRVIKEEFEALKRYFNKKDKSE